MTSVPPRHVEEILGEGASTDLAMEGWVRLRALSPEEALWVVLDNVARSVLPGTLTRSPASNRPLLDLDERRSIFALECALRDLAPLPGPLEALNALRAQRIPDAAACRMAAFGAVLDAPSDADKLAALRLFLSSEDLVKWTLEAVACSRRPVPRARLVFENMAPEEIRFVGLSSESSFELSPRRPTILGRSSDSDIQVIGVMIGGRKMSCAFAWNARGPNWTIDPMHHSAPVRVNGEDILMARDPVPLRNGDCIDPVIDRTGPRFLIRFLQDD